MIVNWVILKTRLVFLGFAVDGLYELSVQCGASGVWLVKFGDLEILQFQVLKLGLALRLEISH